MAEHFIEDINYVEILKKIGDGVYSVGKSLQKSRSEVWKIILSVYDEHKAVVKGIVYCPNCRKLIKHTSQTGTSSLLWHIKKCKAVSIDADTTNVNEANQEGNIYQSQMSKAHKEMMLNATVDFVTMDMRPVNALYGEGLHSLLTTHAILWTCYGSSSIPSNLLPSSQAVSKHIKTRARKLRESFRDVLGAQFSSIGGSICLDVWTDDFKKISYLGITAHYIDNSYCLNSRLISCKALDINKSKTGEYLNKKLMHVLNYYGIDPRKNVVFVTDRGSNVLKALEHFLRHNCANHFISNVVNEGIRFGKPNTLLKACQDVVSHIKNAGKNALFNPTLKAAMKGRWNTALDMFVSISPNWQKIQDYLRNSNQPGLMGEVTKEDIVSMIQFLKPFKTASLQLQPINSVTQHLVHMYYDLLEQHLIENENDPQIIEEAKSSAEYYYRQALANGGMVSTINKIAVFFHPSMKELKKMTPQDKNDIEFDVRKKLKCLIFISFFNFCLYISAL